MKIIISHDIDHLSVWEHKTDLIIPKAIIRNTIELAKGYIKKHEFKSRCKDILQNKWQQIDELMAFDNKHNIPATLFIGVNNGLGLSYPLEHAKEWIDHIIAKGFDIGVHGIEYLNIAGIEKEFASFKSFSGLDDFGIRMHYLRCGVHTLEYLNKTGYLFDSTVFKTINPYKIGGMWEFPLQIMDGFLICGNKRWQSEKLENVKEFTLSEIENASKKKLKYFSILFHDRYFTPSYYTWSEWYIWLINWLQDNQYEFISYKEAIQELESILTHQ